MQSYWKTLTWLKHKDITLNSITQTREKCVSLFWVELTSEWHEDVMAFHVFIHIFCLGSTVRKNTWMRTTSVTVIVIFLNSCSDNITWSNLCLEFFFSNYKALWERQLRDTLQLKNLGKRINIRANSFLGKYHETKIDKGAWKIISCTNFQVGTLKNHHSWQ